MSHLFISYSRKDLDFVDWLAERLSRRERVAWVDRNDLTPTDEWWKNIQSAIEEADAFVLLLGPELLESQWCRMELEHALLHRKRLIPLARHPIDPGAAPREVAALQWLPCSDATEEVVEALIRAADLDLGLVRHHTHWARAAREWEARQRAPAHLLPADTVKEYEAALPLLDGCRAPLPTQLTLEYLAASRTRVDRNQRLTQGGALGLAVLALVAALVMFLLYQDARRQERIGTARRLAAEAQIAANEHRLNHSILLTRESLQRSRREGITNPEADQLLRSNLGRMARPISTTQLGTRVEHVKLSADGTLLFAHDYNHFEVVDVTNDRVRADLPLGKDIERILELTFQGHAALWLANGRERLFSWSEAKPGEVESLRIPIARGYFWLALAFSPDGQLLAGIDNASQVVVWRVQPQPLGLEVLARTSFSSRGRPLSLAFSPDNQRLAIASGDSLFLLGPKGAQPFKAEWLVQAGTEAGVSTQARHLTFSKNGRWLGAVFSHPQSSEYVALRGIFQSTPEEQTFHLWALPEKEDLPVRHVGSWGELWAAEVRDLHIREDGETVLLSNRRGRDEAYLLPWNQEPLIGQALAAGFFEEKWSPIPFEHGGITGYSESRLRYDGEAVITVNPAGVSCWARDSGYEFLRIEEPSAFSVFDALPEFGLWVTGTESGQIRVWKTGEEPDPEVSWRHSAEHVQQIISGPDGGVIAFSGYNDSHQVLGIWSPEGEEPDGGRKGLEHEEDLSEFPVLAIDPSDPGALLVGDSQGLRRIRHHLPFDGGALPQEPLASWPIVALAEDGTTAVTSQVDGGSELRDLRTGEHTPLSPPSVEGYVSYLLSRDGNTLVTLADREVTLWKRRAPTGPWRHITTFSLGAEVGASALSPSGMKLALSQGSDFLVWDSLDEEMSQRTASHTLHAEDTISSLAFSRDEQSVASSAGPYGFLDVWDLESNTRALRLGQAGTTELLHFTRDGRYLVSGHTYELQLHPLEQASLIEDACSHATYNFSQDEWERFFRNEPYVETCPKLPRAPSFRSTP